MHSFDVLLEQYALTAHVFQIKYQTQVANITVQAPDLQNKHALLFIIFVLLIHYFVESKATEPESILHNNVQHARINQLYSTTKIHVRQLLPVFDLHTCILKLKYYTIFIKIIKYYKSIITI